MFNSQDSCPSFGTVFCGGCKECSFYTKDDINFMAEISITIKVNEEELETLIGGDEEQSCDCCEQEKTYSVEEMLNANLDELNWYKKFLTDNKELFDYPSVYSLEAKAQLEERIKLGEQIVRSIRGQ
jgi:hypothetical protein